VWKVCLNSLLVSAKISSMPGKNFQKSPHCQILFIISIYSWLLRISVTGAWKVCLNSFLACAKIMSVVGRISQKLRYYQIRYVIWYICILQSQNFWYGHVQRLPWFVAQVSENRQYPNHSKWRSWRALQSMAWRLLRPTSHQLSELQVKW